MWRETTVGRKNAAHSAIVARRNALRFSALHTKHRGKWITAQRTRKIVPVGEARIEAVAEGEGPLLVLLPSSSRDSEDFAGIAASFATPVLDVQAEKDP